MSVSRTLRAPWGLALVLGAVAVAAIAHDLLAAALDRAGLVEQLLSPSDASAVGALLAGFALYTLRLGLTLVAPPAVAAALALTITARGGRACGRRP